MTNIDLVSEITNVSDSEKEEIARALGIPAPTTDKWLGPIWLFVIAGLVLIAILFGVLAWDLLGSDKAAEGFVAIASGAAGAIAGLLAPSPASS